LKKKLTDKDKQDWLNFLESKDSIENKDKDFKRSKKNLIEKTIDLHGYSLDEANKVIFDFIEKCYLQGVNKINIITGKGSRSQNEKNPYQSKHLGILKYSVPDFIQNSPELMSKIKKIDLDSIENFSKGNFEIIMKKK
tara:strand:- start:3600 stop:4013 length:414 start_codon:yes stop_codon:yes gene_type:complete